MTTAATPSMFIFVPSPLGATRACQSAYPVKAGKDKAVELGPAHRTLVRDYGSPLARSKLIRSIDKNRPYTLTIKML